MKNRRKKCLLILASIIFFGILSRKLEFVPLCIGDILYGSMIFFILRFISINNHLISVTTKALTISFTIEFLQLYQGNWMLTLRNTFGTICVGCGIFMHGFIVVPHWHWPCRSYRKNDFKIL